MTLSAFKQAPWQHSHPVYRASALAITPAPEYASSEVLVSSLYRTIGYEGLKEGGVPQAGRDTDRRVQKAREKRDAPADAKVGAETWNTVLHGVLESPKLPNQSSKRFLQVSPLVPGLALFSGSARLSNNSWPAGSLIRRMAWLGSSDHASAQSLWSSLFAAMGVDGSDDVFARWLQLEAEAWAPTATTWKEAPVGASEVATLSPDDFANLQFPARQFARDLRAIISAKDAMTRRQWTSLLEAMLRLASVSHVTWLCDVQARIWSCVSDALGGGGPLDEQAARTLVFPSEPQYMTYGGKALLAVKDKASAYLSSRLGINAVLWSLQQADAEYDGDISTGRDIASLCQHIRENRKALADANIAGTIAEMLESEARALHCKKGIGSNLLEFARHVLGQRQTASPLLRGYDQGYVLRKRGASPSSPWVVALGPVSVLAVVHCALAGMGGPRSIHRLAQHLSAYGISVDRHDIANNDLGHQLRMLGLVLDSPDAESGMLLVPPFPRAMQDASARNAR